MGILCSPLHTTHGNAGQTYSAVKEQTSGLVASDSLATITPSPAVSVTPGSPWTALMDAERASASAAGGSSRIATSAEHLGTVPEARTSPKVPASKVYSDACTCILGYNKSVMSSNDVTRFLKGPLEGYSLSYFSQDFSFDFQCRRA